MRKIVVLGDIFCDHITDLADGTDSLDLMVEEAGHDAVAEISVEVGGGGLQFALEARRVCQEVTLIGKVGAEVDGGFDPDAVRAVDVLRASGVATVLAKDFNNTTGRSIIVYLAGDRRLMVSDSGANLTLCRGDISAATYAEVGSASVLHVSGYLLVQDGRRAVALDLMAAARAAGASVALDVVPHELDSYVDPRVTLPSVLAHVDWIYVAASTASRILGVPKDEPRELATLLSDGKRSVAVYPHPGRALVLHQDRFWQRTFEYLPGSRSRGQSAHTQAMLVDEFALGGRGGT